MLVDRRQQEEREDANLAPYAMRSRLSRGRRYPEEEHPLRTCFQRDRDRVIHCSSFRRLEYKTQVFVNHEGDNYRTRLTHSLEGAQIGRTVARVMGLNEELTETLVLGHDLGHTPFGHSGERAMDELMRDHGGFEHNHQTLRILEVLERRYPGFPGLNLTWEVREGIIKHQPDSDATAPAEYAPGECPTLEAQLVDFVDEIAYNNHDIDDGLTSGMVTVEQIRAVPLFREAHEAVVAGRDRGRARGAAPGGAADHRPLRAGPDRDLPAPGGPGRRLFRLRGEKGRAPAGRLLARDGGPGPGAEGLPLRQHVPPLPRGAHGGQGGTDRARPLSCVRGGAAAASAALPGARSSGRASTASCATTSRG